MNLYSPLQNLEGTINEINAAVAREKAMLEEVVSLFENAPTYLVDRTDGRIDQYHYFLYPFKGMSLVNTQLYALLATYLARMIPKETEVIVTIEADGIGIATLVAAELGLPLIIAKHYHYRVPCIEFTQQAGYHKRQMFLPKLIEGKKVAIVDCMVSTGGTVESMVDAINSIPGTTMLGTFCVNDKHNYRKQDNTLAGYPYKYLLHTHVEKNGTVIVSLSWDMKKTRWESFDMKFHAISQQCSTYSSVSKRGYQVGALIVDAETFRILAWGYRRGNLHAEQDAIGMLKHNCPDWAERKLTFYSTMEPCIYRNDHGQMPCAHHISQLPNCKWIVIGSKDEADAKIDGEGISYLRKQGKHIRLIDTDEILRPVD